MTESFASHFGKVEAPRLPLQVLMALHAILDRALLSLASNPAERGCDDETTHTAARDDIRPIGDHGSFGDRGKSGDVTRPDDSGDIFDEAREDRQ